MPIQATRYEKPFELNIEKIGGLVTALPSHTIPNNALSYCLNFFKDSTGRLSSRWGTVLLKDTGLGSIDNIGVLYKNGLKYIVFSVGEKIYKYDDLSLLGIMDTTGNIVSFTQFKDKLFMFNGGKVYSYDGIAFNLESDIPYADVGISHKNRLWLAGDPNNPDFLYYSGINDETDWSTDGGYYIINTGDGDKIVALDLLNEDIIVFKGGNKGSVWRVILGSTPTDTIIKGVIYGVTAKNKFATTQSLNDMAFFTKHNGLQVLRKVEHYGLTKAIAVSLPVDNVLTLLNPRLLNYTPFNSVLVYSGNEIYLVNYLTNEWFYWNMKFNPTCFVNIDNELWIGDNDGKIYKFDSGVYNDNGVTFDKVLQTKSFNFGTATYEKYIRNFELFTEVVGGSGTAYLDIEKDLNITKDIGSNVISISNVFTWDDPNIGWDDVNYGWDGQGITHKYFTVNINAMYLGFRINFVGDFLLRVLGYSIRGSIVQKEKE